MIQSTTFRLHVTQFQAVSAVKHHGRIGTAELISSLKTSIIQGVQCPVTNNSWSKQVSRCYSHQCCSMASIKHTTSNFCPMSSIRSGNWAWWWHQYMVCSNIQAVHFKSSQTCTVFNIHWSTLVGQHHLTAEIHKHNVHLDFSITHTSNFMPKKNSTRLDTSVYWFDRSCQTNINPPTGVTFICTIWCNFSDTTVTAHVSHQRLHA